MKQEEPKQQQPETQLTDEQILSYPTESLSKEQIGRRIMLAQLRKAEREVDVVEDRRREWRERESQASVPVAMVQ